MREIKRFKALFAFVISASSMPAIYLLQGCRLSCAACPLGGICAIAFPFMMGAAFLLKFAKKVTREITHVIEWENSESEL